MRKRNTINTNFRYKKSKNNYKKYVKRSFKKRRSYYNQGENFVYDTLFGWWR